MNPCGEPGFDVPAIAIMLLRGEVADGKTFNNQPALLQQSCREYHPFKPQKFKEWIYQEFCCVKFLNYVLRVDMIKAWGERRPELVFCILSTLSTLPTFVYFCLIMINGVYLCLEVDKS
jgi:hypothetical protein